MRNCTRQHMPSSQKLFGNSVSSVGRARNYQAAGLRFKQEDFNFEIVNFPFLDRDVPRSTYSFCESVF